VKTRFRYCQVVLGCAALLSVAGCPQAAPPENAVTWGIKAATGALTDTTSREWQAVAEKIDAQTPQVDVALTDEQAQAIVDFVKANNLDTIQNIRDLVQDAQADPTVLLEIEIPDSVMALFGDASVDVESFVLDTQSL